MYDNWVRSHQKTESRGRATFRHERLFIRSLIWACLATVFAVATISTLLAGHPGNTIWGGSLTAFAGWRAYRHHVNSRAVVIPPK